LQHITLGAVQLPTEPWFAGIQRHGIDQVFASEVGYRDLAKACQGKSKEKK
jgi:hypothetical protein